MKGIYDQFNNRPMLELEPGGGDVVVETAGYISTERSIRELMEAGQRLVESRADYYDLVDGQDDGRPIDPTRSGSFDLADATLLKRRGKAEQDRISEAFAAESARRSVVSTNVSDEPK